MTTKEIQKIVGVTPDGIIGPNTKAAIKAYQRKLGVTADGIWGPKTQAAYEKSIAPKNYTPAPVSTPKTTTQKNYTPAPVSTPKTTTQKNYTPAPVSTPVVNQSYPTSTTIIPETIKAPTTTTTSTASTLLKKGSSGAEVSDIQAQLGIANDGIFGSQTEAAVMKFQQDHGLTADGIVGPQTKAALAVAKAGGTTKQIASVAKPADDPSNQYRTDTGEINTNYNAYVPPTDTKKYNAADIREATEPGKVKLSDIAPTLASVGSTAGNTEVSSGIAGIIALMAANNNNDSEYNNISKQISDLVSNIGNKENDFKAALAAEQVPETKAALEQLNLKLAQIQGEISTYDANTATGLNNISDQSIPQGLLVGQSAAYQRQRDAGRAAKASELAANAALQQAYSNNLSIAVSLAEASVNYKWDGIATHLSALQAQLSIAKDIMDAADAKQLNILSLLLSDQQDQVAANKAKDTEINKYLITAIGNGAELEEILAAQSFKDPVQVAAALQKYLTAAEETEAKTVEVGDQVYQWNPATQRYDIPVGGGTTINTQKIDSLKATVSNIDELISKVGKNDAINPGLQWFQRLQSIDSDSQAFIGSVEQLLAQKTLETIIDLKAQGATLGALSNEENRMLAAGSSRIGTWRTYAKDGTTVIGYRIDEDTFKEELNTLKSLTQKLIDYQGGTSSTGNPFEGDSFTQAVWGTNQ